MLSKENRNQFSRQILLPEIGISGQEKLAAAKVLIAGAGGLGCPVLQYLVAAGVGHIGITDPDTVQISNLPRQTLYTPEDAGQSKAVVAALKLNTMNPGCQIDVFPYALTAENASALLQSYEIAVDCTDSMAARYALNVACRAQSKPMVYAGIYKMEGQLSVFHYSGAGAANCLDFEAAYPHTGIEPENCSLSGVLGTVPGILGTIQAQEVIKIICGIPGILAGKLGIYSATKNQIYTVDLQSQ
ncbi:MAG: HesA/MoeB/ThiF family protein [Bacteroidetes bacterium]|nr:HesA/MoeB/ThiF family protein [Bacteroidota bacterium]